MVIKRTFIALNSPVIKLVFKHRGVILFVEVWVAKIIGYVIDHHLEILGVSVDEYLSIDLINFVFSGQKVLEFGSLNNFERVSTDRNLHGFSDV